MPNFLDETGLSLLWNKATDKFVNKSGDTMTGDLIAPTTYAKGTYPSHSYMNADGTPVVLMQVDASNHRLTIHQKRGGASVWDSNEAYFLPAPSLDQTATVSYDILTSKNPVTIAQGGTGATTAEAALTNLGALPISGGTLTGSLTMGTGTLFTTGHMNIGSSTGPYLYTGGTNFVVRYGDSSNYHYANFTADGPIEIDGTAVSLTGHTHTPADVGAAPASHDHSYISGAAAKLQNISASTASLEVSVNNTPIIWARNNGKTSWSLERNGATQNTMAAHYYDEDGNWTTSGFLLDHQNFTAYVTPAAISALSATPSEIEFMPGTSASHGGYLDFHFNSSSSDYTSRIIEYDSGVLSINEHAYVKLGTVTGGIWNGSAIPVANGGTGAVNEVTAANNLKVQSLGHGTDIPANADLNAYTTVGNYRCSSTNTGATIANCPVANAFTLQVYASTGASTSAPTTAGWAYFIQKLTALNGAQYYRTVNFLGATTATFGDWVKIYDSVNNKPTAADVGAVALNGDSTVNGTITATKVIGAVYA